MFGVSDTLEPYTKLQEDITMKLKSKILSYLFSLGIAASIAFATGINETVDALILAAVWILIVLGAFTWIIMGLVLIGIAFAGADLDQKTIDSWKKMDKPKWWISIPLSIIWLTALGFAGWTVTAVFYFVNTLIMWLVVIGVRSSLETIDPSDSLDFIQNDELRDEITNSLHSKKKKSSPDEDLFV